MNFSLVYLAGRFVYRIADFIRDWYVGGFFVVGRRMINVLEYFDRVFALKVTLRNIFQPLYQDHTAVGHLFGFVFRSARLLAGALIYFFVIVIAAVIYVVWAMTPVIIIYRGFF